MSPKAVGGEPWEKHSTGMERAYLRWLTELLSSGLWPFLSGQSRLRGKGHRAAQGPTG